MPSIANGTSNTIRILVSTDNHVGYNERDPVRGDDSWKTFHEIMCLAQERDVDFVLLGGDLFHENVPSRKSLYHVMRSLRVNCFNDKPCEVQLLSDGTEHFDPSIGHANYEDENINVGIPVFSIHGNHDDPSGDGHYAALDILEMSGLINYFGRVPHMDDINVKPLLFRKGSTNLALFGISNVRDERMYRTFRDKHVTWHAPPSDDGEWFNIGVVHQNHHAHGATSYLPENFLPEMLDLVIWGHEHECKIEPSINMEMDFKVMQPGSSVATSLAVGEAVQKKVAILEITGRSMEIEPIPLKTVRPFVFKEIILNQDKEARKIYKKHNYRTELTEWLKKQVEELIEEANQQWRDAQATDPNFDGTAEPEVPPLPLIRLRVDISGVDDGNKFEVDNPQRFSGRFANRVANTSDLVQFHVRKRMAAASRIKLPERVKEMVDEGKGNAETVDISRLVQDYLSSQSLTILPQNSFGDAVSQYVDKDDKHAMDLFINDSLVKQIRHLADMNADEEEEDEAETMLSQFDRYKAQMEQMFASGQLKNRRGGTLRYKPKPDYWDDERDGNWEDEPAAMIIEEQPQDDDSEEDTPQPSTRGRGRGRGARGGTTSTRGRGGAAKKTPAKTPARGKKKQATPASDEESSSPEVINLDDDDDDVMSVDSNSQALFFSDNTKGKKSGNTAASGRGSRATSVASETTTQKAAPARKPPARAAATSARQSQLNFSTSQASVFGGKSQQLDDIEDDDDEDAFEPVTTTVKKRKR